MKLLKIENEENALLCIKIMIDGLRSNKDQMEPFTEPFLDLVKQMYANIKAVVEKEFGPSGGGSKPVSTQGEGSANGQQSQQQQASSSSHAILPHALHSPKVLTECPIAVVLIFQTYKSIMQTAMLDFYPLVIDSIKIQPEPQRLAHLEAKEKGETFVGVASGITNREMFAELVKAQVKACVFFVVHECKLMLVRPWHFWLMSFEETKETIEITSMFSQKHVHASCEIARQRMSSLEKNF